MREVQITKYFAEDDTEHESREACLEYEARLLFNKLFDAVSKAVKEDADFALKIERLGRSLAAERVAGGNRLRNRRTAPADTKPDALCDVQPADEYEPGDMTDNEAA